MSTFATADGKVVVRPATFTEWDRNDLARPAEKLIISQNGYYAAEVSSVPELRRWLRGNGYHLDDLEERRHEP